MSGEQGWTERLEGELHASRKHRGRVYLDSVVGHERAGLAAEVLRAAGVRVRRGSDARWFAHADDPRVAAWVEGRT